MFHKIKRPRCMSHATIGITRLTGCQINSYVIFTKKNNFYSNFYIRNHTSGITEEIVQIKQKCQCEGSSFGPISNLSNRNYNMEMTHQE
uniref:Uncharacterized protein n=1 Tax=Arundo donax TaxID=35708 RepID=A0A0A8XU24_ARUDO